MQHSAYCNTGIVKQESNMMQHSGYCNTGIVIMAQLANLVYEILYSGNTCLAPSPQEKMN